MNDAPTLPMQHTVAEVYDPPVQCPFCFSARSSLVMIPGGDGLYYCPEAKWADRYDPWHSQINCFELMRYLDTPVKYGGLFTLSSELDQRVSPRFMEIDCWWTTQLSFARSRVSPVASQAR